MNLEEQLAAESQRRKEDFCAVIDEKITPQLSKINADIVAVNNKFIDLEGKHDDLQIRYDHESVRNAERALEKDAHDRKWGLVICGVKGPAKEKSAETAASIKKLGVTVWGVAPAFAACHRLSKVENSNVYAQFVDLEVRNKWMFEAKDLKKYNERNGVTISIFPDLPVPVRPVKDDIMNQRAKLTPITKKRSSVQYHARWPFVTLRIPDPSKPGDDRAKIDLGPKKVTRQDVAHYYYYPEDNPRYKPR